MATFTTEYKPLYMEPIKWEYIGLKPISLYALMEYFSSHDFMKAIRDVYAYELELKGRCEGMGDWNKELPNWSDEQANSLLDMVQKVFDPRDFPHTFSVLTRVYALANSKCTYEELYIRVVALRETMEDDLANRKLVLIPGYRSSYCNQDKLFGEQVFDAFPSVRFDIKDAGDCYAVGMNTACVFHLMRALEAGLQALATELGVIWAPDPWGENLKHIKAAVQALSAKHPRKSFYSECCIEFDYIKDAWRNVIMHSSHTYDERDAKTILEHTHNLLRTIAEKLSEVV
jgi:HEPN domain-containing protein